jgi:phosphate transport system substrate-binding protein
VQQTPGSVGYVEFAYARENGLSMATLENSSGNFVKPSSEAAALVFEGEEVPADFALVVPDPANPEAYPIAGLTWLLLYPSYDDAAKAEALQTVIDWALTDGKQFAADLGYVPLEADLVSRVVDEASKIGG